LLELLELAGIDSVLAIDLDKEASTAAAPRRAKRRSDFFIKLDQTEPASL
jgi:hypothetical protein